MAEWRYFARPSDFANGHARDNQGRLLTCSHHGRCITRTELDGTITVLASHYRGKRLNSPNDITCHQDGSIWFSDPLYGIQTDYEGGKQEAELPPTLYRLDPGSLELTIAAYDFIGPNGLAFSPDGKWLYVSETGNQFSKNPHRLIRRFDVTNKGTLENPAQFATISSGYADGFCIDEQGNLWSSAGDGVHCLAPDGTLLGKITVGETVSNLCFGGRNHAQLFLCASQRLLAIYTNVRGCKRP